MRGLCLASLCLRFDFSVRWHLLSPDRADKLANDDRKTSLGFDKHKQRSKLGQQPRPIPTHTLTHIHNNKLSNKTILPLGSVSIRSCHIQRTLYLHMASCRCTWQIPKAAAVDAAVAVAVAIAVAAQNML